MTIRQIVTPAVAFALVACGDASARVDVKLADIDLKPGEYIPSQVSDIEFACWSPGATLPKTRPVLDDQERAGTAAYLEALGERPLPEFARRAPEQALQLRFLWSPTFHNPVIVQVTTSANGRKTLSAIRLSGQGGYGPGPPIERIERKLTQDEAQRVEQVIARSRLLAQPARSCEAGFDGSSWDIEVMKDGHYHYVSRWTPDDGPVRATGALLLGLTGWQFERIY
jgi:hypothetical protein